MLRIKIGKSSRLLIFILVIQDHIESIGKPILLKGDEVFLNGLLAQVLRDIAPKPSATFSIQICPKPKSKLGPTDSSYPEPHILLDIATARNPSNSVSPRWPCRRSAICIRFGLTSSCNRSHRVGLIDLLFAYCFTLVPPSCSSRSHRDS